MQLTRDQRLIAIAIHAVKYEASIGYPPQVLIAQWAIESKWGQRPSGRKNLFGMTFNPRRHASFSWVATWEELTQAGIDSLPAEERQTITNKEPMVNRRGWFRVELQRRFADYPSEAASIDDKVGLISTGPRYAAAWAGWKATKDIDAFITAICRAGYATAGYYPQLAQQIAAQKNVARAIAAARAASGIKPTPGPPR
jgi:flagellum-specific peptidoglycan hydrolase FlgJ